jgi:hypothetical protein
MSHAPSGSVPRLVDTSRAASGLAHSVRVRSGTRPKEAESRPVSRRAEMPCVSSRFIPKSREQWDALTGQMLRATELYVVDDGVPGAAHTSALSERVATARRPGPPRCRCQRR